jgi:hypothetical protein
MVKDKQADDGVEGLVDLEISAGMVDGDVHDADLLLLVGWKPASHHGPGRRA